MRRIGKLIIYFYFFCKKKVILWLDATSHTLYRSENQGRDWDKVNQIEQDEASFLYEHPFDADRVSIKTLLRNS